MKKILILHTGGTIGSVAARERREVNVSIAKRVLLSRFADSSSPYAPLADGLFEDAAFPYETLSENMTLSKWNALLSYFVALDLSRYEGVIVLHGTDTLAYTATLLSLCLSHSPVPIMLVAGARPPSDPLTNANENFATAVALIVEGIAPNVYVPYQNSDGVTYLHLGASLMQCPAFSDDFKTADPQKSFALTGDRSRIMEKCLAPSRARKGDRVLPVTLSEDAVLLLSPFVGMNYSRLCLDGVRAVVHASYHSGTVCVERATQAEGYGAHSFLTLADRLRERNIPLFIAPCAYDGDKYSSTADAVENGGAIPLLMTAECAYVKLCLALALGYEGERLTAFMKEDIAGEALGADSPDVSLRK